MVPFVALSMVFNQNVLTTFAIIGKDRGAADDDVTLLQPEPSATPSSTAASTKSSTAAQSKVISFLFKKHKTKQVIYLPYMVVHTHCVYLRLITSNIPCIHIFLKINLFAFFLNVTLKKDV